MGDGVAVAVGLMVGLGDGVAVAASVGVKVTVAEDALLAAGDAVVDGVVVSVGSGKTEATRSGLRCNSQAAAIRATSATMARIAP